MRMGAIYCNNSIASYKAYILLHHWVSLEFGPSSPYYSSPSLSSSEWSSSGEDTEPGTEEESEGECSDTVPGKRSEWVIKCAEEVKGEEGFELVEGRASRRLAKRERQREIEQERVEREAEAEKETKQTLGERGRWTKPSLGGQYWTPKWYELC